MGGTDWRSSYVDYEAQADRYRHGRTLPPPALTGWREAVAPHLPPGHLWVADVGAGTGIFAEAWPQWVPANVVAVEPSHAMIRAGPASVRYVRAAAERLPLATASMDVVWLSTALHHFRSLHHGAAECARVLRTPGCLLVRTFLPERTEVSWVGAFPGYERALARFPSLARVSAVFGAHGLAVSHVTEVREGVWPFAAAADWVEGMRHADSMLTALTDPEIAAGLRALRAEPERQARVELSLVVLRRTDPDPPPAHSAARSRSA